MPPLAQRSPPSIAASQLRCERRPAPIGHVWIALAGELDNASAPLVEAMLRAISMDVTAISIDLSELEFMDSSGIHMFRRAAARARELGVEFTLRSPRPAVQRILDLARVTGPLVPADAGASRQDRAFRLVAETA